MPIRACVPSILLTTTCSAAILALAGCHSPGGGIMPFTGGSQTYVSTEMAQKTIVIVDVRTGEEFFRLDVPPGKQLVIDFDSGEGDDNVYTPDQMRYEVMDAGDRFGKLENAKSVPNAASRRIDVEIKHGPQYASAAAMRPLRTDEVADRPDWWTAKGGPMPEDKSVEMYDN